MNWGRSVSQLASDELAQYLENEIKRRWPEDQHPFHIEVVGQESNRIAVRVWNASGMEIVKEAFPERYFASPHKSPTVAAVLHAVESAVDAAAGRTRR